MKRKMQVIAWLLCCAVLLTCLPAGAAAVSLEFYYGEEQLFASASPEELPDEPVPVGTNLYETLSTVSRVVYDGLMANLDLLRDGSAEIQFLFPEETTLQELSLVMYQDAMNAFNRDHSEIFWLDMSKMKMTASMQMDGRILGSIVPVADNYYTSAYTSRAEVERDIALMESRIEEIAAQAAKLDTVHERLLYIHDWLVAKNACSSMGLDAYMRAFEAVSALEGNLSGDSQPVCEGYARAFDLLCRELGIPSLLISGEGVNAGNREAHMWNQVRIDGKWYAVDVTWDDPLFLEAQGGGRHTYFLIGSETECDEGYLFRENHIAADKITTQSSSLRYPALESSAFLPPEQPDAPDASAGVFQRIREYTPGLFSDVSEGEWYTSGVVDAYRFGFMNGTGDGKFGITGEVSVAQALTMAVNIHRLYHDVEEPMAVTPVWYDAYVQYAFEHNILRRQYDDYTAPITRADFAVIFMATLPEDAYPACNEIADGTVPDVAEDAYYRDAAYLLYRAGILAGNEVGEFLPDNLISRAEASLIVSRVADETVRVRIEE